MKTSELRAKTTDQLKETLLNMKKESFNLRFQKTGGQLEKTSRINEVRKTIAKIKTLLREEELEINKDKAGKPAKVAGKKHQKEQSSVG